MGDEYYLDTPIKDWDVEKHEREEAEKRDREREERRRKLDEATGIKRKGK